MKFRGILKRVLSFSSKCRFTAQCIDLNKYFYAVAVFSLLCSAGLTANKAHADINDVPSKIALSESRDFSNISYYPGLFGSDEERASNLKPFTKWSGMFEKFERELNTTSGQKAMREWTSSLKRFSGLPLHKMAARVNGYINRLPYIVDQKLWGKSDYWATPVEFLKNGGDCEDFAIAKYTALRVLGVPESRLRLAIVHDNVKNIPHAVLVVYSEQGPLVLDNQSKNIVDGGILDRYRPIFSINRQAWWLHTAPNKQTILASAE